MTRSRSIVAMLALAVACTAAPKERERGRRVDTPPIEEAEWIFSGKLLNGWQDQGVAKRKIEAGKALEVNMRGGASFSLLSASPVEGVVQGLLFTVLADAALGELLEVRLDSSRAEVFPRVTIGAQHRREMLGGWNEVFVPIGELNPKGLPYDRVVFRSRTQFKSDTPVYFDKIALIRRTADTFDANAPPSSQPLVAKVALKAGATEQKSFAIDCFGKTHKISPMIYGIAVNVRMNAKHAYVWSLNAAARRWGGNPMSRYNWEHGTAWNTGSDYFFKNVNYSGGDYSYRTFIRDNVTHNMQTALTVPMLGWVAKDTHSFSFPVSEFGAQRETDPEEHRAGNGVSKDGKPIPPGPPGQTSVQASPQFIARWIAALRAQDAERRGLRGVHQYILDNEPDLWDSTHRDVHPEPLTYDELLRRTIEYGSEIRKGDPQAVIAGPASWGWTGYFYSAADAAAGFQNKPDRKKHGDVPLLPWYLQQLKKHEDRTGTRLLDVVDVHFYPAAKGVFGDAGLTDPQTAALRIRSTRALWDPLYVDESWVKDTVKLIPRLREWITIHYPGRGISIGEWNFGGEQHMSGGLALAEALGRFGTEDVTSAFYWTYPPDQSPAYWAWRAYRDYDGKRATFQEVSVPARAPNGASIFAARNEQRTKMTAILLNFQPDITIDAHIDAGMCGRVTARKTYTFTGEKDGFKESAPKLNEGGAIDQKLPPYSITVMAMDLSPTKK
ncbi:MAG: glycoside hydrolase family 44 protein [Deltaproteobacteria bacterium]|nr:glycoside hydrolase family 44 protein [Deltaproteobacteria bacterium]